MGWAGVGPPPLAGPTARWYGRRQQAWRRHVAAVRSRRASAPARVGSRLAASSTVRTSPGVSTPSAAAEPSGGVTPVGLHAVAWRAGRAGGRADVAPRPRLRQLPLEPGPAGLRRTRDQMLGLRVTRAHARVTSGSPMPIAPRQLRPRRERWPRQPPRWPPEAHPGRRRASPR